MAAYGGSGGGGRGGRFTLRMPGFSVEPIQFTRGFWNTRRTLRALWTFVVVAVLVTITGEALRPCAALRTGASALTRCDCTTRSALRACVARPRAFLG